MYEPLLRHIKNPTNQQPITPGSNPILTRIFYQIDAIFAPLESGLHIHVRLTCFEKCQVWSSNLGYLTKFDTFQSILGL